MHAVIRKVICGISAATILGVSYGHTRVRYGLWLTGLVILTGCATVPGPTGKSTSSYVVIFELYPNTAGSLQRLAVSRVLEQQSGRTVIYLPSAIFVDRARDSLAERTWSVTYDPGGKIRPAYVPCDLSPAAPDTPVCTAPE